MEYISIDVFMNERFISLKVFVMGEIDIHTPGIRVFGHRVLCDLEQHVHLNVGELSVVTFRRRSWHCRKSMSWGDRHDSEIDVYTYSDIRMQTGSGIHIHTYSDIMFTRIPISIWIFTHIRIFTLSRTLTWPAVVQCTKVNLSREFWQLYQDRVYSTTDLKQL